VIDAPTALRIGLAHEMVPDEELEQTTYALAEEIAANAPLSVQGTKRVLRLMQAPLDTRATSEIDALMRQAQSSRDMQEGRQAFLEKRPPKFEGR
jgi:enoyl-CoA hydratase/carnithine racemase